MYDIAFRKRVKMNFHLLKAYFFVGFFRETIQLTLIPKGGIL